ncbi:hypothetical protein HMPREF9141_2227 [Prevotella multiformis DSM 16608]|uniref:Uncharacterized protein n=1 Tax=Prevotella multiformis DSM 16608 TaxID=888743 RepID=F0F9G0_9BACT|nr:hypothetical protein HMPREF9141_2227 [Prevotella multiformis DSM 16608]
MPSLLCSNRRGSGLVRKQRNAGWISRRKMRSEHMDKNIN